VSSFHRSILLVHGHAAAIRHNRLTTAVSRATTGTTPSTRSTTFTTVAARTGASRATAAVAFTGYCRAATIAAATCDGATATTTAPARKSLRRIAQQGNPDDREKDRDAKYSHSIHAGSSKTKYRNGN
jgi:hypothetical protein